LPAIRREKTFWQTGREQDIIPPYTLPTTRRGVYCECVKHRRSYRETIGMIVTIDGPAGTGKSSVARALAERLGFEFLNTGAMYRAVALACLERNIPPGDDRRVAEMTRQLSIRFADNKIFLDGRDVSDDIRWDEVTQAASVVASNPEVRRQLVELQRACGTGTNLVTEGRDQGTIVFPRAECKFFLTASPEERAWRRLRELAAQGRELTIAELLAQQAERDRRDETRACAPLKPADDAILIDTSHLSLEAVVEQLVSYVRQKLP
jgi:cytidylate kinase